MPEKPRKPHAASADIIDLGEHRKAKDLKSQKKTFADAIQSVKNNFPEITIIEAEILPPYEYTDEEILQCLDFAKKLTNDTVLCDEIKSGTEIMTFEMLHDTCSAMSDRELTEWIFKNCIVSTMNNGRDYHERLTSLLACEEYVRRFELSSSV